jgi:hypothetical protein
MFAFGISLQLKEFSETAVQKLDLTVLVCRPCRGTL